VVSADDDRSVRRQGIQVIARAEEESEGISGVAVVIVDAYGDAASLTVSGPSRRIDAHGDDLAAALLATAGELNAALAS
jgi:DNA-binding IclR family transcriptional regulator